LWTLGTLGYFELNRVPFLQALVSFACDGAVVDKNICSVITSDESITLGIVEPLNGTFQTFHVRPLRHDLKRCEVMRSDLLSFSSYGLVLSRETSLEGNYFDRAFR